MTTAYGGPFECPSGLHGNVWCTCPAPIPREPLARRMGTCHGCGKPFNALEMMVTVFEAPRFKGVNLILHKPCALEYLNKANVEPEIKRETK